jgi:putative ABC transport system substrate-binding protein
MTVGCRMRRRNFIAALTGAAATWPLAALGQQGSDPLIGFLSSHASDEARGQTDAFLRGLAAFGYIDGRSAKIEYRWANGQYDRLPALARELVALRPAVLVAPGGTPSARAAKSAAGTIPIVFVTSEAVRDGLVASLNRPGGNATGVDLMTGELGPKRLELLIQLVPGASVIGFLANAKNGYAETYAQDVRVAARAFGRPLVIVSADSELEKSFATFVEQGVKAVVVQNDASFDARRSELIQLAAKHHLPAIYHIREFPAEGGLMSYGPNLADSYYQGGLQTGRVLKGAAVADLPVVRPTRFELVINSKVAAALGLAVPASLLAQADEVIE